MSKNSQLPSGRWYFLLFGCNYLSLYLPSRPLLASEGAGDTRYHKPILAAMIGIPGPGVLLIPGKWNHHHCKQTGCGLVKPKLHFTCVCMCVYLCTYMHTFLLHLLCECSNGAGYLVLQCFTIVLISWAL